MMCQYAGWQAHGRLSAWAWPHAAAGREELFDHFDYKEDATHVVGVLETSTLPTVSAVREIAEKCGIETKNLALLAAPTSSIAGNLQVVSRSIETALREMFELAYDVTRVESALGWAPLAPVAADDLAGIGRTNDAILYGGRVTLMVNGDDESIAAIGPRVPSSASPAHGQPFINIFEQAGRDFYKIDPLLFSPAEVVFHNVETGRVHHFGGIAPDVLKRSFGL